MWPECGSTGTADLGRGGYRELADADRIFYYDHRKPGCFFDPASRVNKKSENGKNFPRCRLSC